MSSKMVSKRALFGIVLFTLLVQTLIYKNKTFIVLPFFLKKFSERSVNPIEVIARVDFFHNDFIALIESLN